MIDVARIATGDPRRYICSRDHRVHDSRVQVGTYSAKLFGGPLVLELSYDLPKIRKMAVEGAAAEKVLGKELAHAFLSLVSDMRNAIYLGELLDHPMLVQLDPLLLQYTLATGCVLEVQPLGSGPVDQDNWFGVHRIKLVRVIRNGAVIT